MNRLLDNIHYIIILLGGFTILVSLQVCCSTTLPNKVSTPIGPVPWQDGGIVIWQDLPLKVHMDMSTEVFYKDALLKGMNRWNEEIGCKLFVPTEHPTADIFVGTVPGPPEDHPNWAGSETYFIKDNGSYGSNILFYHSNMSKKKAYVVQIAIHELGHSLGVGHSPNKRSIMYRESWGAGKYIELNIISAIKVLYCKDNVL